MNARLIDQVVTRVLLPLARGGEVRPVPPIGEARAVAETEKLPGRSEDADAFHLERLRAARRLTPLDALPLLGAGEWYLACALNDLLQCTNPTLEGAFSKRRSLRLLGIVDRVVERAGSPASVGDALVRYASFRRVKELVRIDTHVKWWSGSRSFHAMHPPDRLRLWPRVRRVSETRRVVPLFEMGGAEPWTAKWTRTLSRWLCASPLLGIASLSSRRSPFRWSGALLGLLETPNGRALALRAVERTGGADRAALAAREAAEQIPVEQEEARQRAFAFSRTLDELRDENR